MARKAAPSTLIHCDSCGEDYSSTYKRCPFCGERPGKGSTTRIFSAPRQPASPPPEDDDDDFVFEGADVFDDEPAPRSGRSSQSRGGKRLAEGSAPGPVNWPRVITFLCSIVIIIAALVIVFVYIYPKIHSSKPNPTTSASPGVSVPVSQEPASPSPSDEPSADPSAAPSDEPSAVPSGEPSAAPSADPGAATGITLSKTDFTLKANESYTIRATVAPSGWTGTVTWTSSNEKVATVSQSGTVTNVNSGSSLLSVTITASAGGRTATAKVYCRGGSSGSAAPSGSPSTGGALTLNREDFTLALSGTRTFTMKATGADSVAWSTSNSAVATVSADGTVSAVAAGRATITATAADGRTATCIVRVRD